MKNSWGVYKAGWKTFVAVLGPAFAASAITIAAAAFSSALGAIVALPAWILGFAASLWVSVALLYAVKGRSEGAGAKRALAQGWKKILPYWWVVILSNLIIWGGFVLFVVPGVIFSIWFSLALYALVSENLGGMNALLRSKQLVAGYWWGVFWRLLVLGAVLIALMAPILAAFIATGAAGFLLFGLSEAQAEQFSPIGEFLVTVGRLLVSVFGVIFGFLLYEDLKRVKGNPKFETPSVGTKWKHLAIGIVGIVVFMAILGTLLVLVLLNEFRSRYELPPETNVAPFTMADD